MCVSANMAQFTGTTIYLGQKQHPDYGPIFVLGYQNRATNLSEGPNVMLLHFPALSMTKSNFLDTSNCKNILSDMKEALSGPRLRSREPASMRIETVEVFGHGIYTVVLVSHAKYIPDALDQVPARKRVALNRPLFDFYADHFPGYPVAFCCFDNRDARESEPLLLWYRPINPDFFVLPGLDCHTGEVPMLHEHVKVDHWIIVASDDMTSNVGSEVQYSDKNIPGEIQSFLPSRVIGKKFLGTMPNGDFALLHHDVVRGDFDHMQRIHPPQ